MFHTPLRAAGGARAEVSGLLGTLAKCSKRPRYAFMLLTLIAEVADEKGSAGPWVETDGGRLAVRDWLGEALAQMAERESKRQALVDRAAAELKREGGLPADPEKAKQIIETKVAARVKAAAKTNVSRAVSELVKAGLLERHYAGVAVDHQNRGGQRHAVYALSGAARTLMVGSSPQRSRRNEAQAQLPF